jgi:broad specificity phosphatase PhoE
MQRAQALVDVAADAGVSAIYTTQFKRSRDTAQPLAERLGVAVTEVPVDLQNPGDYGKALAKNILENHSGQAVMVIGHGNTIGSIAEGLTGRAVVPGDIQYSDLFIIIVPPSGQARLVKAQYGTDAAGNNMMMKK